MQLSSLIKDKVSSTLRRHLEAITAVALRRNSRQAVRKLCETDASGALRFRHEPPLLWRFNQLPPQWVSGLDWMEWNRRIADGYLDSLPAAQRHVIAQFQLSDVALKAVGVGSVGTRCAVSVFVGEHPDDVLVMQGKQATASVLAQAAEGWSP